jgi:NAD(P)-dependent dehydrogenase (short-subunit alcohol dehydrogenase family)
VRALDAHDDVSLVLGVRDLEAGRAVAKTLRRAETVALDTGSLASIRALTSRWDRPLDALVHNAGVQETAETTFSVEGIETTLAVNHLGPLALTLGLSKHLRGGRVVLVGSGTHNPDNRTATMFGFRGGRFTNVEAHLRGECDAPSDRQRGMDRYATSKLLAMLTTMALARRQPHTSHFMFDPGLMPGTGLARTAPPMQVWAWKNLLPWLAPLLPDTSTPERSAASLTKLLDNGANDSGEVYAHDGTLSRLVWKGARDHALSQRVLDESLAALSSRGLSLSNVSHARRKWGRSSIVQIRWKLCRQRSP